MNGKSPTWIQYEEMSDATLTEIAATQVCGFKDRGDSWMVGWNTAFPVTLQKGDWNPLTNETDTRVIVDEIGEKSGFVLENFIHALLCHITSKEIGVTTSHPVGNFSRFGNIFAEPCSAGLLYSLMSVDAHAIVIAALVATHPEAA